MMKNTLRKNSILMESKNGHFAKTIMAKVDCGRGQYRNKTNPGVNMSEKEIRKRVECGFKENRKYESVGKKSLNNIVFDPDGLALSSKRKLVGRASEKCLVRKFEKPLKSNRVLLRVGGVRLSLMDYQPRSVHKE